jgi:hypothetical protein
VRWIARFVSGRRERSDSVMGGREDTCLEEANRQWFSFLLAEGILAGIR